MNPFDLAEEAPNLDSEPDWFELNNPDVPEVEFNLDLPSGVFKGKITQAGFYTDLSNDEYRSQREWVSKSDLVQIAVDPASFMHRLHAPIDETKLEPLTNGSAFHCYMTEHEEFNDRFIIMPSFDGRTNAGKASKLAFENEVAESGLTIISADFGATLPILRESVMVHPTARLLFEMGYEAETSGFYVEPTTGEQCKFRPDMMNRENNWMVDLKSMAQFEKMAFEFEDKAYEVQDALYSDGYRILTGEQPSFYFIVCSTSINCGKYDVAVIELDHDEGELDRWTAKPVNRISKPAGREKYLSYLEKYAYHRKNDEWATIRTLRSRNWR
jgi:exodeoxyribonuclease VIII